MNRAFCLLIISGSLIGLCGCQSWGGYSAQSVTRVPPIGTGTYQVPGSYYGNAASPTTTSVNPSPTSGSMALQSMSGANGLPSTNSDFPTNLSPVTPADYTTTTNNAFDNPAVTTAGGSDNGANLQWQR